MDVDSKRLAGTLPLLLSTQSFQSQAGCEEAPTAGGSAEEERLGRREQEGECQRPELQLPVPKKCWGSCLFLMATFFLFGVDFETESHYGVVYNSL